MFYYGEDELNYLRGRDPKLGGLFDEFGIIRRESFGTPFSALVNSIAGQQISSRAQEAVVKKLKLLLKRVSPESVLKADLQELRACGLRERKALAICDSARLFKDLKLTRPRLKAMEDSEIVETLSSVKGVGAWTAEMLMIFSLDKPDVLSYADFGIRKGLARLHNMEKIDKKTFEKFRALYSPFGSVASLYLWALANKIG